MRSGHAWIIAFALTVYPLPALSQSSGGLFGILEDIMGKAGDAIGKQLGVPPREPDAEMPKGQDSSPVPQSQTSPVASPPLIPPREPTAQTYNQDRKLTTEVQRHLNSLGYDAGPVDGAFGRKTSDAIRAFQKDLGVKATGNVSPALAKQLRFTSAAKNEKANPPSSDEKTGSEPPTGMKAPEDRKASTEQESAPSATYNNPVVPNAVLGAFRHGTFPSLGDNTHVGVDLVAPCGSPVYAFADGEVVDLIDNDADQNFNSLGYMVLLRHAAAKDGKPVYSLYLHLATPPEVKKGDTVKGASNRIGGVGETGVAQGCHTHFEVRHFPGRFHPTWKNIYPKGAQADTADFKWWWSDPEEAFAKAPAPARGPTGPIAAAPPQPPVDKGAKDLVTPCDRMATGPYDQHKKAPSVYFERMTDAEEAEKACRKATADYPDEPRFGYLLGRALWALNRKDEAYAAYKDAAAKGSSDALFEQSFMVRNGIVVPEDPKKALAMLLQDADSDAPNVLLGIARSYAKGLGTEKDEAASRSWYGKAVPGIKARAETGDEDFQFLYGMSLMTGAPRGVEQDKPAGVEWLKRAADKYHRLSIYQLGRAYLYGQGVEKDLATAIEHLTRSAELGHWQSYLHMGDVYRDGMAVPMNLRMARLYYETALNAHPHANSDAEKRLTELDRLEQNERDATFKLAIPKDVFLNKAKNAENTGTKAQGQKDFTREFAALKIAQGFPRYEDKHFSPGMFKVGQRVAARKPAEGHFTIDVCPNVSVTQLSSEIARHPKNFSQDLKSMLEAGLISKVEKSSFHGTARHLLQSNPVYDITCYYAVSFTSAVDHLIVDRNPVNKPGKGLAGVKAYVYMQQFDEVTGVISPLGHVKEVEFTYRRIPTVFGRLLKQSDSAKSLGRAKFVLYDDGWRLVGM